MGMQLHTRPISRAIVWIGVVLAAWPACGGGGADGEEGAPLLAPCNFDVDCGGGVCVDELEPIVGRRYCSRACAADEPCPMVDGVQWVCARQTFVDSACSKPCADGMVWRPSGSTEPLEQVCVNGVPTPCWALSADEASRQCEACGCGPDEYCSAEGCAPLLTEGQVCADDEDCLSRNCGVAASDTSGPSKCLAALGAECTLDNCQRCSLYGGLCTRDCTGDWGCPPRWHCIGSQVGPFSGTCRPACYNGTPFGSNCPDGLQCLLDGNASWCERALP